MKNKSFVFCNLFCVALIILLFATACKKETLTTHKEVKKSTENTSVVMTGISDDKKINENISFYNDSIFFYNKPISVERTINGNSVSIVLKEIKKPTLFEIIAFGEDNMFRTRLIASPGDSISYTFKEGKIKFKGNKAAHYNFYLEMDREYDAWSKLYLNKYNPNFQKYKQQCDSLYNKRLTFFKDYIKKHPDVSEEFKNIIETDLRFEHLVNLIKPRSETQSKWNVNTQEDLFTIYERGDKQEGEFFDIDNYLDNITLEELNQPEYENYLYYKMSIVPLIRQYFVRSNAVPYSIESFKEELKFLQNNFNETIIKRVTARLIFRYFSNGFGKDKNSNSFLKETIAKFKKEVRDPNIIKSLEDMEYELSAINKSIPEDLNELVLNLSKDTVSFTYALQQKRIKVIDFWASWCGPCIDEIIISKDKRERLAKKYNVDFLYLSTDKDIQKWIDKSIELYAYLPDAKQYKILSLKKSKLIKYLNLKNSVGMTIPRYVILDENNVIIDNNAPKPSDEKFEEVFLK